MKHAKDPGKKSPSQVLEIFKNEGGAHSSRDYYLDGGKRSPRRAWPLGTGTASSSVPCPRASSLTAGVHDETGRKGRSGKARRRFRGSRPGMCASSHHSLAGCKNRFLFYPYRDLVATPAHAGIGYEDVTIPAAEDGVRLNAWWVPCPGARGTVLFCHGNGGEHLVPCRYHRDFSSFDRPQCPGL